MSRGPERRHDDRVPGLTVQREALLFAMQAQLIGTLEIDTSTNCLVLRTAMGTPVGTGYKLVDIDIDVAWPLGWSAAIRDGKPALIDATGRTAARVGDEVSVGGGSVDTADANVVPCTGQEQVFVASGLSRL